MYVILNTSIKTVNIQSHQWDCYILVWQSVFSPSIVCEIKNSSISLYFTVHDQTLIHNQKIKLRWNTVMLCMEWSAVLVVNSDSNKRKNKPVQSCAHCSAQPFVVMSLSDDDISYSFDIFCNKTPTCICAYKM